MSHAQSCGCVRHTRSRRYAADTHLPCGPCIAICHQSRRLLMSHKNVLDLWMLVERVVNCHGVGAWYPKDDVNTMPDERVNEKLAAGHTAPPVSRICIGCRFG